MRIVYIAHFDPISNGGVHKKIKAQVECWQKFGHDVRLFRGSSGKKHVLRNLFLFEDAKKTKEILYELSQFNPDIVYYRFRPYTKLVGTLGRRYRLVIEVNTDDVAEYRTLASRNPWQAAAYIYNLFTRSKIFKACSGIVCVSKELSCSKRFAKFRKPITFVPNSIDVEQYALKLRKNNTNEFDHCVFLGTGNVSWHGVERIFELAMALPGVSFTIIGKTGQVNTSNVRCYGYMEESEYTKVLQTATIGIGTLALFKNKMKEASVLKVREYVSWGLPLIIGYEETAFIDQEIPEWVFMLPNSPEDYSKSMIENLQLFIKKMRNYIVPVDEARQYFDIHVNETKRISFFESLVKRSNNAQ